MADHPSAHTTTVGTLDDLHAAATRATGLTDAGDQDEAPAGAIARVDRRSLEARIVAFPPDGDILAVERPEWSTAPDGSTYDDLVRPAEAPAPPEMVLALGPEAEPAPLAVDLAAVEELFT